MFQPYFYGALAYLDPSGRFAATGPGMISIGSGIGPALAGFIALSSSLRSVGLFVSLTYMLSACLILPTLRRLDQKTNVEQAVEIQSS